MLVRSSPSPGTAAPTPADDASQPLPPQQALVDEPTERGGTNAGPSPTETMLGALATCTNVITHKIAAGMGVEISAMHVGVAAAFDRRGVTLAEEVAVPFPEIELKITLTTDADDAQMEDLKRDLARF